MTTVTPPGRPPLTARQAEVLAFLREYRAAHGYAPSFREIGDAMAIRSPNGVKVNLRALASKGYIETDPHVSRGIRLMDNASDDTEAGKLADALEVIRSALRGADPLLRRHLREMIRNRNLEVC